MQMNIGSPGFPPGRPIPTKYTADGENVAPPLKWSKPPAEAKEILLICDDPDAPTRESWVHWIVYGIPTNITALPEGTPEHSVPPSAATIREGLNSFGDKRYGGPAPPKGHGPHRYYFKMYAVDKELNLPPGAGKVDVINAMKGHIVAQGQMMGVYQRT